MRRQRGFTLLEAIVAMVIFTIGALALYQWQATSLRNLGRVQRHAEQVQLGRDALEVVRGINPMQEPDGERELGDRRVTWTSEPIESRRAGRTPAGYPSLFDLGLFELDVRVLDDGVELTRFKVRQVGFEQTRQAVD